MFLRKSINFCSFNGSTFILTQRSRFQVTVKRLSDFLLLEENSTHALVSAERSVYEKEPLKGTELSLVNGSLKKPRPEPFVELSSFTGKWSGDKETATLSEVSFKVR